MDWLGILWDGFLDATGIAKWLENREQQKVGDVQIRLTKVDEKHNRYTMVVMADDKLVEKKDKTTNEPVQFYAGNGHTPDEVVVNEVGKDTIKGYLATPKVNTARK